MGDLVNLRRLRKAKARASRDEIAAANRLLFGRSKAEREETAAGTQRARRHLDGHRRDRSSDDA